MDQQQEQPPHVRTPECRLLCHECAHEYWKNLINKDFADHPTVRAELLADLEERRKNPPNFEISDETVSLLYSVFYPDANRQPVATGQD